VSEISPKLRGTLPAAARSKMSTQRGGAGAGRGDNPHHVPPVATEQDVDPYDDVPPISFKKVEN
jgi:hypothetical protein